MIDYDIMGLENAVKALQELGPSVERKALRTAAREASKAIALNARQRAPRKTGRLRRNIVWVRDKRNSYRGKETFNIGVYVDRDAGKRGAYYWYFVEMGTRKMRPQPFIRPAEASERNNAIGIVLRRAKEVILEEARKSELRSRGSR